jgi:hypothetical protein
VLRDAGHARHGRYSGGNHNLAFKSMIPLFTIFCWLALAAVIGFVFGFIIGRTER